MVRIWDLWLRENKDSKTLPPIVPLLLSNAGGHWQGRLELVSLMQAPRELIDALHPHLPSFEPLLTHLANILDEELEDELRLTALARMVLLLLKHASEGDLRARAPRWMKAFQQVYQSNGVEAVDLLDINSNRFVAVLHSDLIVAAPQRCSGIASSQLLDLEA